MKLATYLGERVIVLSEPNPFHWLLWFEHGKSGWMQVSLTSSIEIVDDQWLVGLSAQLGEQAGRITSYRYDPAYPIGTFIGFTPDGSDQQERTVSLYPKPLTDRLQITLKHEPAAAPRRGRPRTFGTNADRQRAYRERQKALRNAGQS